MLPMPNPPHRGRPRLPEGEKLIHISIRIPVWLRDALLKQGNVSEQVRRVLEEHFFEDAT